MITLKEAQSESEVRAILSDEEIFKRISEDGASIEDFEIPFDGQHCYLMLYIDEKPIGVWCLYALNSSTLRIHCNILNKYRYHSHEAAILILKWFEKECSQNYVKLNAEIPLIYPDVYHYTKRFGFKDEGINRHSIMKGGSAISQWSLGMTRHEVSEFLGRL